MALRGLLWGACYCGSSRIRRLVTKPSLSFIFKFVAAKIVLKLWEQANRLATNSPDTVSQCRLFSYETMRYVKLFSDGVLVEHSFVRLSSVVIN